MKTIRMSEVVKRDHPDFVIQYTLLDGISLTHFPGSLLNFAYDDSVNLDSIHFDIFPEFRMSNKSNDVIRPKMTIPTSGIADMWIVSERNKEFHHEKVHEGMPCFLLKGDKVVGKAVVLRQYYKYKIA